MHTYTDTRHTLFLSSFTCLNCPIKFEIQESFVYILKCKHYLLYRSKVKFGYTNCIFLILLSSSLMIMLNTKNSHVAIYNFMVQIHIMFGGQVIPAGYQVQVNKLCR